MYIYIYISIRCFLFDPYLPNLYDKYMKRRGEFVIDTISPPVAAGQSACSPDNPGKMVNFTGQYPVKYHPILVIG